MLRLDDHWVWDSWVVDDGERYHLFYLQAPRCARGRGSAAHPRHGRPRQLGGPGLLDGAPGRAGARPPGSWDDLAIWTGLGGPRRRRRLADVLHGDLDAGRTCSRTSGSGLPCRTT